MYVFGGLIEEGNQAQSDFWQFHFPSKTWLEIYPNHKEDVWPSARMEHCAVMVTLPQRRRKLSWVSNVKTRDDEDEMGINLYNQMFIFGGYSNISVEFSDELYCYDFTDCRFHKVEYHVHSEGLFYLGFKKAKTVAPRSRFAMVNARDEKLYIIGGMTNLSICLMDVWEYDIDSQTMTCLWEDKDEDRNLQVTKEECMEYPEPRCFHSCVYCHKEKCSVHVWGYSKKVSLATNNFLNL